jgi:hypothetical protein
MGLRKAGMDQAVWTTGLIHFTGAEGDGMLTKNPYATREARLWGRNRHLHQRERRNGQRAGGGGARSTGETG